MSGCQTILRSILDATIQHFQTQRLVTTLHHAYNDAAILFARNVSLVAPFFKHSTFRDEQEWRLVHVDSDDMLDHGVEFRPTPTMLVPYLTLYLPTPKEIFANLRHSDDGDFLANISHHYDKSLMKIIVGPGPHQQLEIRALERMVNPPRTFIIQIAGSQIPYRNW